MQIHESAENYLEAILMVRESQGAVRSIDIAAMLQFSKASVSVAMKKLRENGYIRMDRDGFITLTPAGEAIAAHIYQRHKLLTEFFVRLGVSEATAAADACKVEHDLSEETFEHLLAHASRFQGAAPTGSNLSGEGAPSSTPVPGDGDGGDKA